MRTQGPFASFGGHPGRPAPPCSIVARVDPERLLPLRQPGGERAGRERCGGEKTFVSRAHTPRSRKTPLRLASPVLIAALGESPCSGKGATVSRLWAPERTPGPEAPGRVSAPRPAAPLPSPRPGGARGSSRFGETCSSRVRPGGFGWAGAPPSARRGPLLPPEALRRTKLFPRGSGEGASLPPTSGPRED